MYVSMVDAMVLVASVYFSVVVFFIFRNFDDRCRNEYYKVSRELCCF